jgi:hypothetical protein
VIYITVGNGVIIGATPAGKKELVGFIDGYAKAPNPGGGCFWI